MLTCDSSALPLSVVGITVRAIGRSHLKQWPPIVMVPLAAVSRLVKGMLREYIDLHGVAGLIPKRKLPLTNELITAILATYNGATMGKLVVDRSSRYWVSIFAAFETAAETGVRKDELLRLLVKSILWEIGGGHLCGAHPCPACLSQAR